LNDTDRAAAISSILQDANIQPLSISKLLHWLAHRHDATAKNSSVVGTDVHAVHQHSEQIASNSSDDGSDDGSQQYSSYSASTTSSSISYAAVNF
jgi:hypothetical protein